MPRLVTLKWTPACRWEPEVGLPCLPAQQGLYQVTRRWGDVEELLYLGIVWAAERSFHRRISEHRRDWLGAMRGVHFRFAHVEPCRGLVRNRTLARGDRRRPHSRAAAWVQRLEAQQLQPAL